MLEPCQSADSTAKNPGGEGLTRRDMTTRNASGPRRSLLAYFETWKKACPTAFTCGNHITRLVWCHVIADLPQATPAGHTSRTPDYGMMRILYLHLPR